jgi:hypothetical protein
MFHGSVENFNIALEAVCFKNSVGHKFCIVRLEFVTKIFVTLWSTTNDAEYAVQIPFILFLFY